jgi:hypothetical protein
MVTQAQCLGDSSNRPSLIYYLKVSETRIRMATECLKLSQARMASIKPSTAHAVIHYILGVWEASRDNN